MEITLQAQEVVANPNWIPIMMELLTGQPMEEQLEAAGALEQVAPPEAHYLKDRQQFSPEAMEVPVRQMQ
jgi:hypothetical protein